MTANQIAYASQKEMVRHNEAVEAETSRHNAAQEQVDRDKNVITRQQVELDAWYKQQMAQNQKWYNEKYLALQEAQGDRRLKIENELKNIEWAKRRDQAEHMERQDYINSEFARIRGIEVEELNRHNTEMEFIQSTRNQNDFILENKRNEINATLNREEISVKRAHELNQLLFNNREYQIEQSKLLLREQELKNEAESLSIQKSKVEAENALKKKQTFWYPFTVVTDALTGTGKSASPYVIQLMK